MRKWALWAALLAILIVAALSYRTMQNAADGVARVTENLKVPIPDSAARTKEGKPMAHFHTEWRSGGLPIEVDLDQEVGETAPEFAQRCKATVDAMKAEFQPD